jgi:hypothetical protein
VHDAVAEIRLGGVDESAVAFRAEFKSTLTSLMSKPSFAMLAMIIAAVPG